MPPHGFAKVPLALDIPEKGRCFLCVTYILTSPLQGLPAGHELGFDDIEIQTVDERNQKVLEMFESVKTAPAANSESENAASAAAPESKNAASAATPESKNAASATLPTVTESDTDLIIEGSSFAYTLDTLSGRFTSLVTNGREILTKPVDFNLWRAPTDNDQPLTERWKFERLDHTVTRAYSIAFAASIPTERSSWSAARGKTASS